MSECAWTSVHIRRVDKWRHAEVCHRAAGLGEIRWKEDVEMGWGPGNDLAKEMLLPDIRNIIARY